MLAAIVFSIIFFNSVPGSNALVPINEHYLSATVLLVAKTYFQSQNTIRVFGVHRIDVLHQIFKLGKTLTIHSGSLRILDTLDDTGEYINNPSTSIGYLIVDPEWELLNFYGRVNPNGRWLFVLTENTEELAIRRNLIDAWHQNYMLNTIVITLSTTPAKVYFYNPFLGEEAGLVVTNINQSDIFQQLKLLDQNLKLRFRNLHQHSLNISVLRPNTEFVRPLATADSPYKNFTAVDALNGVFLDYILQFLNATAQEQPNGRLLNNGNLLLNGSLTGILKLIDERVVEICAYNRLVTNLGKCNVAYLRSISRPPLVYIMLKQQLVPTDVLFSVFHCNAVAFQVVFLVWAALTWWVVEISTINTKRRSLVRVILDLTSTLCNIGIKEAHTRLSFRIVFAMVLLYAFMANNVYQGQVVSKLNSPRHINDPQKIEQLLATDIPLTSYIRSNDLYPPDNQTTHSHSQMHRIANRNVFNDDFKYNAKLLQDLLSGKRNVAVLMRINSANGLKASYFNTKTNEDILHIASESPTSFFTAHTVRRDSPFLTVINELTLRGLEIGLDVYANKAYDLNNYLSHLKRYKQTKPSLEMQKITMPNLRILFQLWTVAMVVACLIFCIEHVVKRVY